MDGPLPGPHPQGEGPGGVEREVEVTSVARGQVAQGGEDCHVPAGDDQLTRRQTLKIIMRTTMGKTLKLTLRTNIRIGRFLFFKLHPLIFYNLFSGSFCHSVYKFFFSSSF